MRNPISPPDYSRIANPKESQVQSHWFSLNSTAARSRDFRDCKSNIKWAIAGGCADILTNLLDTEGNSCFNVDLMKATYGQGQNLLHLAVSSETSKVFQKILGILETLTPNDFARLLVAQDHFKDTPLMRAVKHKKTAYVQQLLDLGVSAQERDHRGISALFWSAFLLDEETFAVLIKGGANPSDPVCVIPDSVDSDQGQHSDTDSSSLGQNDCPQMGPYFYELVAKPNIRCSALIDYMYRHPGFMHLTQDHEKIKSLHEVVKKSEQIRQARQVQAPIPVRPYPDNQGMTTQPSAHGVSFVLPPLGNAYTGRVLNQGHNGLNVGQENGHGNAAWGNPSLQGRDCYSKKFESDSKSAVLPDFQPDHSQMIPSWPGSSQTQSYQTEPAATPFSEPTQMRAPSIRRRVNHVYSSEPFSQDLPTSAGMSDRQTVQTCSQRGQSEGFSPSGTFPETLSGRKRGRIQSVSERSSPWSMPSATFPANQFALQSRSFGPDTTMPSSDSLSQDAWRAGSFSSRMEVLRQVIPRHLKQDSNGNWCLVCSVQNVYIQPDFSNQRQAFRG